MDWSKLGWGTSKAEFWGHLGMSYMAKLRSVRGENENISRAGMHWTGIAYEKSEFQ